jgi:hypothetical protein
MSRVVAQCGAILSLPSTLSLHLLCRNQGQEKQGSQRRCNQGSGLDQG